MELDELVRRQATNRLRHDYLPKIKSCLAALGEDDLWHRPNEASNAPGNIVLHLEGNLRQWVVAGLGGAPDRRDRPAEFGAEGGLDGAALIARLEATIDDACDVISRLDEDALRARRTIQTYWVTGFSALFHAVEHFSGHVGQLIWIVKARTGRGLDFYGI